jgi:hypothetical protein
MRAPCLWSNLSARASFAIAAPGASADFATLYVIAVYASKPVPKIA